MKHLVQKIFIKYFIGGFWLSLPQVVSIAITLVTFPIVLAKIPPEDYGLFQFVLSIQVWLNALSAEYAVTGAQSGLARGINGTFIYSLTCRAKFIFPLGILVLTASPAIYYLGYGKLAVLVFLMGLYFVLGYLANNSYNNVFIAKKQHKEFSFWKIIDSIVVPIISAGAAYLSGSVIWYAVALFVANSVVGWIGLIYVVYKNNLLETYRSNKIDKTVFGYGVKLIPSAFILQASNKITSFVIGPFFGFANLAVFTTAESLETRARSLIKVTQLLLYPDFARSSWHDLKSKISSKLVDAFFISLVFVVGFAGIGYFYIHLFLPPFYAVSAVYLVILLIGFPAKILQAILQTAFDSSLKHKEMSFLIIFPSIAKILVVVVFGYLFGIIGMLWGLALFAWLYFLFTYIVFIKHKNA